MSLPNQEFIDLTMDYFENFVQGVLSGADEDQKNHLKTRLQIFVNNFGKKSLKFDLKVHLPYEIWVKILNYLGTKDKFGNFALTCKYFHKLTLLPNTTKWLELKDITNSFKFQNVVKVLKNCKTLLGITIDSSDDFVTLLLTGTLKASKKLKKLVIHNTPSNKYILKYLEIQIIDYIKQSGVEIETLDLNHINISTLAMIEISKIKSLKHLKIGFAAYTKFQNILNPEITNAFANNCNQLESFTCDEPGNSFIHASDMKKAFANLFDKKKMTLKRLEMDLKFKTTEPLKNLNLCQNLEELNLSLDVKDLHILANLPKLKSLTLYQITAQNNVPEIKSFLNPANLTYLSFQECDFTSEVFFQEMVLLDFPVLERFYVNPEKRAQKVMTEKTLKKFVKIAPNLKSIMFGENLDNSDITNAFLFDSFRKSQVFVTFGNSTRQIILENYFMENSQLVYKEYQMVQSMEIPKFSKNFVK